MINSLILGDALIELKKIPSNFVDLIFIDPPYFMQTSNSLIRVEGNEFDGINEEWDKFSDFKEYDEFSLNYLKECKRILKPTGTLWIIGSFQNIYRIGYHLQNLGFWILNDIIWKKTNPTPNFRGVRFTNAHETLIWCKKDKNSKYTFNYKTMKYLNNNKQMQSVWEIPICSGNERIKIDGKKAHPTQKPEKLLEYIILSSSKEDDLVLDPFMGVGTTPAIAKRLNRRYIGIEKEEKYFNLAKKRVENIKPIKNFITQNLLDIKLPKVDIKELIKKGYLNKEIYSPDFKKVELLENGKVFDGEDTLSIHKMAAKFLNKKNYNGWNFWYVKKDNNFILIDEIRKEYRKKELGYEEIKLPTNDKCYFSKYKNFHF